MTDIVTAVARHEFAGLGAEQVYEAWLDAEKIRAWMMHHLKARDANAAITRIEVDPVVGGRFLFADTREGSEAWGYYRALEAPRRIVFTWFVSEEEEAEDNSTVSLELEPDGAGCVAIMRHEMSAEWAEYIEPTARAWKSMLEAIEGALG